MDQTIPRIPAKPRDIGLFVAIAVPLGMVAGNPTAIYKLAIGRPPSDVAIAVLLPVFWFSSLVATTTLVRRLRLAGGIRTFLRERFRWRTGGRWYLVSMGMQPRECESCVSAAQR